MEPLSIGKQDNKFYVWFYVHSVTGIENLDQICSIWQLGQVWGVKKLKIEDDNNQKQRSCWVFMAVENCNKN